MSDIVTVYVVFGSTEEAERIGRAMVEQGLAACVNILGGARSIYRWNGTVEHAGEVPALFKTKTAAAPRLINAIAALHSYDTPAIVQWPIDAAWPAYADWVRTEVTDG